MNQRSLIKVVLALIVASYAVYAACDCTGTSSFTDPANDCTFASSCTADEYQYADGSAFPVRCIREGTPSKICVNLSDTPQACKKRTNRYACSGGNCTWILNIQGNWGDTNAI